MHSGRFKKHWNKLSPSRFNTMSNTTKSQTLHPKHNGGKYRRIRRVIETLTRIQMEEGTHDAGIGAAKVLLAKTISRWETQDRIADEMIVAKLAALGRSKPITISLSRQEAKHLRHVLDAATRPVSPKIHRLRSKEESK